MEPVHEPEDPIEESPLVATSTGHPLHVLVGGPYGAVESAAPSVVFVLAFLVTGRNLTSSLVAALVTASILAVVRIIRREKPIRILGGLLAVSVAALVAARTGSASAYFLPSLLANAASALAWALSIVIRWPLLGVVVGFTLRTGTSWRRDPDLLRGYARASWIWTGSFILRAAIQIPLYLSDQVVWLGVARLLLGWPLVLAVIAGSWFVIRRTLPPGHPGLAHPVDRVTSG